MSRVKAVYDNNGVVISNEAGTDILNIDGTNAVVDLENGMKLGGTAVTSTAAELNILDGVTADAAELNILDGVTSTTAELNILDGVTADAAELNILDGATVTTAALNKTDGIVGKTVTQAKTDNGATDILAAHAAARHCIVIVTVTEVFADGDGGQPTFTIGDESTADSVMDISILASAASGSQFICPGVISAGEKLRVTAVAGTGTSETGAISIHAIAVPTEA